MTSNKMNVLFLDYDGVINTHMIYREVPEHLKNKHYIEKDGYIFDICSPSDQRVSNLQAVTWLEYICKYYNFKIVISSTWRLGHLYDAKEALYNSGLSRDIEVVGATPSTPMHLRGDEIGLYLKNHPEVEKFVIIDDDTFDMGEYKPYVAETNTYVGITMDTFIKISYIMDGK